VVFELVAFKKIIAVFCSVAISFSLLSFPATAITGERVSLGLSALQFAYQLYHDWKTDHPNTPDSEYLGFNPGGMYGGGAGRDDLSAAYDDYVAELPAPNYGSGGELRWRLNVYDHGYYGSDASYIVFLIMV